MKTKISHLGRSTVSVILAVMMLLSTMLIGTISVNAADFFTVGDTLYLDISGAKYDATADNAEFYIKFYKDGSSDFSWSKLSQNENSKVYSGTVPTGEWDRAVFTRVNSQTFDSTKSWIASTVYSSATTTISDKGNNNCWSLNNGDMKGTWTTYSGGSGGGSTSTDYYIAGRFKTKWNADTTEYKFTESSEQKGLYYYDTEETVASLSGQIAEDSYGNFDRYFFIRSSNDKYLTSVDGAGHSFQNNKNSQNYLTLLTNKDTPEERLIKFSNPFDPSNDKVTIWLDTTNNGMRLYYTAGSESSLTHVAESVSLKASPATVTSGGSTKLTATLTNKAAGVGNVTYTFKNADGTVVGTVKNTAENAASVNVDNITSNTTYTVTVSATDYSDVTATATVTVKQLENWYLIGSAFGGKWETSFTQYKLDYDPATGFYYHDTTGANAGDVYFRFHDGKDQYCPESDQKAIALGGEKLKITKSTNTYAFKYSNTVSNYRIWLNSSNASDIKVWITDITKKYSISNTSGKELTISPNQASAGEKVTVTATPENGKVLDTVTVVGADGKSVDTTVSGNTATFTMPDQDVTVTGVTFRDAKTYTVTFSSSNDTFGTVSATNGATPISSSPATVTEGDTVTFTAKPESGYTLSDWTVTANGTSNTYNDSSLSLKITANTTVTANFKVEDSGTIVNNMYFLYGSTNNPTSWEGQQGYNQSGYGKYNVYEKDGKYIVTLNKEHYKQLYFAFSTSNYYKNMTPKDKLAGVNPDNPVDLRLVTTGKESFNADNTQYVFGMMSIVSENSEYIGDIKIIYDPTANTYTVKATKDSASDTTVNIVGKDGTVRAGYYGKTTSALGDTELKVTSPDGTTTITAIDSCNFDGHSQGVTAKKVPYGSTVTVTTKIKPDATFAGHNGSDYYVKGFSINGFTGGVLTQQEGSSHTENVYEYTFTVKEDVYAAASTIEITPIYFLKNDSNCVTFYVENFMDAKAKWGDTIACYAYYSDGEALGGYPGQPMVNAEGSIYMQIPKHIGKDTTNVVKGITLNNYVWDFVHVSGDDKARESKNCQTYDYDDFKYLANMSKVNSSDSAADIKNIVYRFKYHTYNNSSAEAGNVPKGKLPETTVDNTKYEVFVDYYDKPTDIFGTIIKGNDAVTVDTVKDQSEYLTIVSDGYVNYYNDTKNYLGQYATKWYIYNKEGKQVAALPPSALLYGLTRSSTELKQLVNQEAVPTDFMSDSGANTNVIRGYWTSFKSLYKNYEGKYAIINYESSIHSSGRDGAIKQSGERCDGRWYYSVDRANITGDIRIEYADTLDRFTTMTDVKTDTFIKGTATGEITAAEAYFTSPVDQSTGGKPTHVVTTSDNSENFKFTVGATSSTTSGYTFVGWYRLIDDTYKAVNDPSELNKTTGQVARNANVVLVARYIKTPGGSMTFQHSLYKGENAGGGKATTEIQVVVKNSEGKSLYDSGKIAGTASIDKDMITKLAAQPNLTVTVTLYTTTKNLYDFKGYYSAENKTDITAFKPTTDFTTTVSGDRTNGRVTESVYTFSFDKYYQKYASTLTAPDAGTVYYNFYSDITSIKVPYKVQFSYTDRKGDQKYYNKAGYVDPENTSSYTIDEDTTVESRPVKVTLTESFILTLAPYESNFTKNLTWDRTTISTTDFDSSNSESSIASAVVKSTQSDRTIHLNIYKDSEGNPTPLINKAGHFDFFKKNDSAELPYGSVFYTKKDDGTYTYDITADKTYTDESGNELKFMYWAIYSDSRCRDEDLVINAYNSEGHFSYVAYDNCWIAPVYEESSTPSASVKKVYTTTQFMEVTRNQWTAENADSFTTGFDVDTMTTHKDFNTEYGEDKLYADFVLNFFYNGKQLSTFDPDSLKVQAGVLIQRLDLDKNDTTGYITDLDYYANKKFTPEQLDAAKNDAIKKITTGTSDIKSVKQQINNSRLDNKNRLQYYTRFNNVVDNSNYVFRLYTYIQYTDANGKQVVELSDPVYFTFYDIANK